MTTYKFYKNMIIVSYDNNGPVFFSDSQMKRVFSHLLSDFFMLSLSFPMSSFTRKFYYSIYKMIEQIQGASLDHQTTVDMLRNLFFIVNRFNYPEFRINFVNEI